MSVLNAHIRSAQGYRDQAIGDLREILRINPVDENAAKALQDLGVER